MPSEWRETTLGEMVDFASGWRNSEEAVQAGEFPFFTCSREILRHDQFDFDSEAVIMAGNNADARFHLQYYKGKFAVRQRTYVITPRDWSLDCRYLYYALHAAQPLFAAQSQGTTTKFVTIGILRNAPLLLPPLSEQRLIAAALGALDDKIELNRRTNETLESMARALFKSWFVDFDPVHAKAGNRVSGLSGPVSELFPGSFEDSTDGPIPKGWSVTNWGELVTLEYGKSLSDYSSSSGAFPVYGTNGRIGTYDNPLCGHAGIVIGRKGAYRGVHWSDTPFFVIDTAFYVEPRRPLELRWAYYELLRQDINRMDSGSAIPSTSRGDFYGMQVIAPPLAVQEAFTILARPLWERQLANNRESETLTSIRDALLPRLISGELRTSQ